MTPQQAYDWLAPKLSTEERKVFDVVFAAFEKAAASVEQRDEALLKIKNWSEAYPLTVFPEPDFQRASTVLKEAGMTLDAISAANMRHVLNGIKDIVDAGLTS